MNETAKTRIATHIEIAWGEGLSAPVTCPNCGAHGPAQALLGIDYTPPGKHYRFNLLVCPACAVRFTDNAESMDYGTDELIELGWLVYQVQLGAGVWPISSPLTRVPKPPGATMLEIGGAFGFGLDFGARARGWRGLGYDPSPLAAFGATELGLDIRQAYFTPAEMADGPWDVAVATEVIEHLPDPPQFLRLMREAMREDGILVLTTPDAAWITPELAPGTLLPLLSPGAHCVLQTAQSLTHALRAAGFAYVEIRRDAVSLVAYASAVPFVLDADAASGRAMYRRYLVARAQDSAPESDLRLGFAGRGLFEAANDGDWQAANAAWTSLLPGVKARFGLDLETMTDLPAGAMQADLAALLKLMPLGLGMILFGRAMCRLEAGETRRAIAPMLRLAAAAITALQGALGRRSLADGLAASIARILETELLLCGAADGAVAAVEGLLALGDETSLWRGFIELVNEGEIGPAERLLAALPARPSPAIPPGLARNALLSLANFHLAPGQEPGRVFAVAAALHDIGETADKPVLGAFTRLVNASRYEEALAAEAAYEIAALTRQWAGTEAGRDAGLARTVLDLAVGDPADIPVRLSGLDMEHSRKAALLLDAFIRLVNAARYGHAQDFMAAHDVANLTAQVDGDLAVDAAIARAVLALGAGDPAQVPGLLAAPEIPAARREALVLGAFTGLVNAGRYEEAEALAAAAPVCAAPEGRQGAAAMDARWAAMLLDLQRGRAAVAVRRLAALEAEGGDAALLGAFYVDAFVRLVNEADFTGAAALAPEVEKWLAHCAPHARLDAKVALVILAMQPGGAAREIPKLLAALAEAGLAEARLQELTLASFAALVNGAAFETARKLLPFVEPVLITLRPPFAPMGQDALFAAAMLYLQDKADWRRSAASFARLRDGLVKLMSPGETPLALFWPALRGEVLALQRLNRDEEAMLLLRDFIGTYPGAPDDLRVLLKGSTP